MTATSVHKARLKISGAVYEARCGHTVDEPWATDDWTRVSCTKVLARWGQAQYRRGQTIRGGAG